MIFSHINRKKFLKLNSGSEANVMSLRTCLIHVAEWQNYHRPSGLEGMGAFVAVPVGRARLCSVRNIG